MVNFAILEFHRSRFSTSYTHVMLMHPGDLNTNWRWDPGGDFRNAGASVGIYLGCGSLGKNFWVSFQDSVNVPVAN